MATRRGFTLIELLVVISIIALLVGILLPALGAARRSANRLKDLSNIRQFNVAHTTWAVDHKGILPYAATGFAVGEINGPVTGFYRFELFKEMRDEYGLPLEAFGCISYDEITQAQVEAAEEGTEDLIWINWMYYGGLNIKVTPTYPIPGGLQVDVETNEEFNFATTMDDIVDSETLAICSHGMTNNDWGSWLPHLNGTNDSLVKDYSTLSINPPPNWARIADQYKPDGLHIAYRDGSASWREVDELSVFQPRLRYNNNAYFYDSER